MIAFAKSANFYDHVAFPGQVDFAKMPAYYKGSDIYISADTSAANSFSLLEAMACGILPVVSNIPANRIWIADGENGLLINPKSPEDIAKKIVLALKNKSLRVRANSVNPQKVSKLPPLELILERIEYAYYELLNIDY